MSRSIQNDLTSTPTYVDEDDAFAAILWGLDSGAGENRRVEVDSSGNLKVTGTVTVDTAALATEATLSALAGKDFATQTTLALIKAKTDNLDAAVSTLATQATLALIKAKTDNLDAALSTLATAAKQPSLGTAGTASANVITVQGIASMTALKVDGSGVTQPVSGTFWQATQPVSGTVTANAGTNLNTSALALEAGGNLAGAATSLAIMDDWDESDRAKVNIIAGQVGVAGGSGVTSALTQRVVLATDVALPTGTNSIGQVTANAGTNLNTSLLALEAGGNLAAIAASLSVLDDWDETNRAAVNTIAGQIGVQGASGVVTALTQRVVLATDVALPTGSNVIGHVIADTGSTTAVTGTVTAAGNKTNNNAAPGATNVGALVGIANAADPLWTEGREVLLRTTLAGDLAVTLAGEAVVLGAGSASIGDVNAVQSGTWNIGTVTAVTAITDALPAGTNAIGKLAANSGVDIGDVTVTNLPATADVNLGASGASTLRVAANLGLAGVAVSSGNGASGTGTVRVTLASDSTGIVSLTTSTASIGKLAANSGVDIGDVTLTANSGVDIGSVAGLKTNNNAAPGATNLGALTAIANAADPLWTEGNEVLLRTTLAGDLAITLAGEAVVLGAGSAAIGKLAANSGVDIGDVTATNFPATADVNLGASGASTLRVAANIGLAGVAASTGNGVVGTGVQRVAIASDNTAFSINAIQSGTWNIGTLTSLTNALPAGTNAIGKLAANSGVDIGDVTVTDDPTDLRASYSVTTGAFTSVVGDTLTLTGSATKAVYIYEINIEGVPAGNTACLITLNLETTAVSGGVSVTDTAMKMSSANAAATAVVKHWTTAPTAGSVTGAYETHKVVFMSSTGQAPYNFKFGPPSIGQYIRLSGTSEILAIKFDTSIANTTITIKWIEI